MTTQGSAHGRFVRAIRSRNLVQAELALREMGTPSLVVALDYLELLAEAKPQKLQHAALRWHGRLELEVPTLTIVESQLAVAALADICTGSTASIEVLRRLVRKVKPTLLPQVG